MKEILSSFQLSLKRFEEILKEPPGIIIRDASIQRFEFTVELAWKSIQRFLRNEQIICKSPKQSLQEAFKYGLIQDDPLWLQMMEDRNLTTHTYQEAIALEVYKRLPQYLPILKNLSARLQEKIC